MIDTISTPIAAGKLAKGRHEHWADATMKHVLELDIDAQPTDSSCGPTCLAAIYRYWEYPVDLPELIQEVGELATGGTLLVHLACHALRSGFDATIITYNLQLFDPTWFAEPSSPGFSESLCQKLQQQLDAKKDLYGIDVMRLRPATEAFLEFLDLGGAVKMETLKPSLVENNLKQGLPILCGLSATYLYNEARERHVHRPADAPQSFRTSTTDDVAGVPSGHFVVLHGFHADTEELSVADPLHPNPKWPTNKYRASLNRVFASILLGVLTHDANLLVIAPRDETGPNGR